MAITPEQLTRFGLAPEVVQDIVNLSAESENAVIGRRVGEIHGQYEQDILALTGISKTDGEKAYDYNKRVVGLFKADLDKAKTTEAELNSKINELNTKIANNTGDEALKQQLKDLKQQLADSSAEVVAKTKALADKDVEFASKLNDYKVTTMFDRAMASIEVKTGITDAVRGIMFSQAQNEILSKYDTSFVKNEDGIEHLVFRDKVTSDIVRNPNNNMQPFTIEDLVKNSVARDIISIGRTKRGGGTGANGGSGGSGGNMLEALTGAKTQVEADKIIFGHLMGKGLVRGTPEFTNEVTKMRADNEVDKLPIR